MCAPITSHQMSTGILSYFVSIALQVQSSFPTLPPNRSKTVSTSLANVEIKDSSAGDNFVSAARVPLLAANTIAAKTCSTSTGNLDMSSILIAMSIRTSVKTGSTVA